jgi:hypothetical protein
MNGGDCPEGQFRRNVVGDAGQAQDLDVKCLTCGCNGFQVFAAVTSEPELEAMAGHGLLDRVDMTIELIANGRPDEVGAICIEPLVNEKVDVTKVDIAEIDGDLLAVARLGPQLAHIVGHRFPSLHHPYGWNI